VWTPFFEHFVQGGNVVPREAFALVFAPENITQRFEVFEARGVVVGPDGFGAALGLEAPFAAEALGAGFAFFTAFVDGFPDVNISHGTTLPVCGRSFHGKRRDSWDLGWSGGWNL